MNAFQEKIGGEQQQVLPGVDHCGIIPDTLQCAGMLGNNIFCKMIDQSEFTQLRQFGAALLFPRRIFFFPGVHTIFSAKFGFFLVNSSELADNHIKSRRDSTLIMIICPFNYSTCARRSLQLRRNPYFSFKIMCTG